MVVWSTVCGVMYIEFTCGGLRSRSVSDGIVCKVDYAKLRAANICLHLNVAAPIYEIMLTYINTARMKICVYTFVNP